MLDKKSKFYAKENTIFRKLKNIVTKKFPASGQSNPNDLTSIFLYRLNDLAYQEFCLCAKLRT